MTTGSSNFFILVCVCNMCLQRHIICTCNESTWTYACTNAYDTVWVLVSAFKLDWDRPSLFTTLNGRVAGPQDFGTFVSQPSNLLHGHWDYKYHAWLQMAWIWFCTLTSQIFHPWSQLSSLVLCIYLTFQKLALVRLSFPICCISLVSKWLL